MINPESQKCKRIFSRVGVLYLSCHSKHTIVATYSALRVGKKNSNMTKVEKIEFVRELLTRSGFTNLDYMLSLQGPTLFLTVQGRKKFNSILREVIVDQMGFVVN